MTVGWRVEKLAVESPDGRWAGSRDGRDDDSYGPDAHSPAAEPNPPPGSPAEPRPVPTISTDNRLLDETIERSFADLALLRNDGPSPGEHYLAAGIPWFATLFGRDSIIAAIETVPFMPANRHRHARCPRPPSGDGR